MQYLRKKFVLLSRLNVHKKIHQGYQCDQCDVKVEKWSLMRKHKLQHAKKHTCDICSMEFKTLSNYRSHLATHQKERQVFHCKYPMCPRWYVSQKNLNFHVRDFHESDRFPCNIEGCKVRMKSRASKARHMKNCHSDEPKKEKIVKENSFKKPRKDYGLPKKSTAADLIGMSFDCEISKDLMVNGGEVELTKEALEHEIVQNDDENIKKLVDQSFQESESERETEGFESNNEQMSEANNMPFILLPHKVQAILKSDDESDVVGDYDKTPCKDSGKKDEIKKKYDFSIFLT